MPRINTWSLALERVSVDRDTYTLPSTSPMETRGSVPALVYDAEERTIWSKGGRKHAVTIDTRGAFRTVTIEYDSRHPWRYTGDADGNQRARIQHTRARALIRHAVEDRA